MFNKGYAIFNCFLLYIKTEDRQRLAVDIRNLRTQNEGKG